MRWLVMEDRWVVQRVKRTGPKTEFTLWDTTGEFVRIGLRVVDRHCLEPVVQIGLESGEGGIVGSKCILKAGEKNGVVNSTKGSKKV